MDYPAPHYDEDDTCQCPDHVAMREAREDDGPMAVRLLSEVLRHAAREGSGASPG